jgi:hypothetical protein
LSEGRVEVSSGVKVQNEGRVTSDDT